MKTLIRNQWNNTDAYSPIAVFGEPVEILSIRNPEIKVRSIATGKEWTVSPPPIFYKAENPPPFGDFDKDWPASFDLSVWMHEAVIECDRNIVE